MSRHFWIIVAVIVIVAAVYYPFSPGGVQRTNMRRAEQHIPTLKPLLENDPRFADIELGPYTGGGGSLIVHGEVASEADKKTLQQLINDSNPPTAVRFSVYVRPAEEPGTKP